MRKNSVFMFAFFIVITLGFRAASAQFHIKIPKLPKTEKTKQEQPKTDDSGKTQTEVTTAKSQPQTTSLGSELIYKVTLPTDVPVLLKNSIYVQAETHNEYWKLPNERDYSSWIPVIRFSQFYNNDKRLNYTVEYFNPDGSFWFSEKTETGSSAADLTVMFRSSNPYERLKTKSTIGTGVYSFKITNQDTKEVLYQGKFKIGKFSTANRPQEKNKFDFFVEHDWLLPFGVIGFHHSKDIEVGGVPPQVSVWLKGYFNEKELEGRLFYKGQQIASTNEEYDGSGVSGYEERASDAAAAFSPQNYWKRWQFQWGNFRFDNNGPFNRERYPNAHYADKNPGDYTVKIYRNGAQIREMSFSIGADGRFVVPAYTKQIFLPYHRIVLLVKVVGATEKWDAAAWKTDAFYGNPLNGFVLP